MGNRKTKDETINQACKLLREVDAGVQRPEAAGPVPSLGGRGTRRGGGVRETNVEVEGGAGNARTERVGTSPQTSASFCQTARPTV